MGLFKKKKSSTENLLDDKKLKENLADTALSILVNQKKIAFEDFAGIKAEFGYLLMIDDHGLEGLFKIIKDNEIYYFAAQQDKLMLININELQYHFTIDYMLEHHKVTDI